MCKGYQKYNNVLGTCNNINSCLTVLYIIHLSISGIINLSPHLRTIYFLTSAHSSSDMHWMISAQAYLVKTSFLLSCLVVKVLNPKKKGKKKKYINSGTVRPALFYQQLSHVSWTWVIAAVTCQISIRMVCHEPPCDPSLSSLSSPLLSLRLQGDSAVFQGGVRVHVCRLHQRRVRAQSLTFHQSRQSSPNLTLNICR